MTDDITQIPVSGSLSAKVIRKCPTHAECPLECAHRTVEELGEIARFDARDISHDPTVVARLKEAYFRWRKGDSRP